MIQDRIVVGVRDAKLNEKMQLETALTLAMAVKMVRECESIKKATSSGSHGQNASFSECCCC